MTPLERIRENPFIFTRRLLIETSNRCNYARQHRRCPAHYIEEPRLLPAKIVYHILETAGYYSYQGDIAFQIWNEPLGDPRLCLFIGRARRACPAASVSIKTNGFYLTQTVLDELVALGVGHVHVTAYSKGEYARLSALHSNIQYGVKRRKELNPCVLKAYKPPSAEMVKLCGAPFRWLTIFSDGRVGLCPRDWQHRYSFGDLAKQPLDQIMRSAPILETFERLRQGERWFKLCQGCTGDPCKYWLPGGSEAS